jgi:hypothetical protein
LLIRYDTEKYTPRFESGFGLGNIAFKYSNQAITKIQQANGDQVVEEARWGAGEATEIREGSGIALR